MPPETADERAGARAEELSRALDGGIGELPPNQVKGFLGEKGPDMRRPEDFTPDLNAGISQEVDFPVMWLGILLGYVVFFPVGFWLLWRSPHVSRRAKVALTAVGAAGVLYVAFRLKVG